MSKTAHQPGKRLAPSNGGTGPRSWQGTAPTVAPVAVPSGELYDDHGWQPNGVHRKTGTSVSPEGVPVSFSKALRAVMPTITEKDVTRLHGGSIPLSYVSEALRCGASAEEVEMLWAERWSEGGLHRRYGVEPPTSAPQAAPVAPRVTFIPSRVPTRASTLSAGIDALRNLTTRREANG